MYRHVMESEGIQLYKEKHTINNVKIIYNLKCLVLQFYLLNIILYICLQTKTYCDKSLIPFSNLQ